MDILSEPETSPFPAHLVSARAWAGEGGQKAAHAAASRGSSWPILEADAVTASAQTGRQPASLECEANSCVCLAKETGPESPTRHTALAPCHRPFTHIIWPYQGPAREVNNHPYTHFTSGETRREPRHLLGQRPVVLKYMTILFDLHK